MVRLKRLDYITNFYGYFRIVDAAVYLTGSKLLLCILKKGR